MDNNAPNDVLSAFAGNLSPEEQAARDNAIDHASADGKGKIIDIPGTYRMQPMKVMFGKEGRVWPRFFLSDQPKTMNDLKLDIALSCVDGSFDDNKNPVVNKGDIFFITLTIKKGPGADMKKIENTAAYAKPVLCALSGSKDAKFTDEFLRNYFTVDIKDKEVVRDHKMTHDVMVVLANSVDKATGKSYFNGNIIRPAKDDDKSMSVKSFAAVTDGAVAAAGKEVSESRGDLKPSTMSMPLDGGDDMPLPGGVTIEDC